MRDANECRSIGCSTYPHTSSSQVRSVNRTPAASIYNIAITPAKAPATAPPAITAWCPPPFPAAAVVELKLCVACATWYPKLVLVTAAVAFAGVVVITEVAVTLAVHADQVVHGAPSDQDPDVQPGQSDLGQLAPPHLFGEY